MKKTVVLLGLATILVAGGCTKEDKLSCTKTTKDVNYVQNQEMKVTVKSEKIKRMTLTSDTKFDDASDEQIKSAYDMMKNVYSSFDKDGIDVDVTKDKKNVKAVIDIDFDKANEDDVKQFTSSYSKDKNDKIAIKDIKESMEDDGYTCK